MVVKQNREVFAMKKLSLLIAMLIVLSALASCGSGGNVAETGGTGEAVVQIPNPVEESTLKDISVKDGVIMPETLTGIDLTIGRCSRINGEEGVVDEFEFSGKINGYVRVHRGEKYTDISGVYGEWVDYERPDGAAVDDMKFTADNEKALIGWYRDGYAINVVTDGASSPEELVELYSAVDEGLRFLNRDENGAISVDTGEGNPGGAVNLPATDISTADAKELFNVEIVPSIDAVEITGVRSYGENNDMLGVDFRMLGNNYYLRAARVSEYTELFDINDAWDHDDTADATGDKAYYSRYVEGGVGVASWMDGSNGIMYSVMMMTGANAETLGHAYEAVIAMIKPVT